MESAPQVGRVLPFVLYLSSRNTHKVLVSQRGDSYWQVVLIFFFFNMEIGLTMQNVQKQWDQAPIVDF